MLFVALTILPFFFKCVSMFQQTAVRTAGQTKWEYSELAGKKGMWQKCMYKLFTVAPTELSAVVRPRQRKFSFYDQLHFYSNSKQHNSWSGSLQQPWICPWEVFKSHQCRDVGVCKEKLLVLNPFCNETCMMRISGYLVIRAVSGFERCSWMNSSVE